MFIFSPGRLNRFVRQVIQVGNRLVAMQGVLGTHHFQSGKTGAAAVIGIGTARMEFTTPRPIHEAGYFALEFDSSKFLATKMVA